MVEKSIQLNFFNILPLLFVLIKATVLPKVLAAQSWTLHHAKWWEQVLHSIF